MSQWYKKKGVPQNEMAVCLIVEQQLPPLQLKLNTIPLQNMKAPKVKVMQNKSYHTSMEKKEEQEENIRISLLVFIFSYSTVTNPLATKCCIGLMAVGN